MPRYVVRHGVMRNLGVFTPRGRDAYVRGEQVIIAHHDTVIRAGDHVIVFVVSKRLVPKVEKLFQVGFNFV